MGEYGRCPLCRRTVALSSDGSASSHGSGGRECEGSGGAPEHGRRPAAPVASAPDVDAGSAADRSPTRSVRSGSARFHQIRKVSVAAVIVLVAAFMGWQEERENESAKAAWADGQVTSAGTGGTTSPDSPPSPIPPGATTDESSTGTNDAFFVAVADANDVQYSTQAEVIALGHAICSQIDAGVDPYLLAGRFVSNAEWTPVAAGAIVGSAVAVYCPEHGDLV